MKVGRLRGGESWHLEITSERGLLIIVQEEVFKANDVGGVALRNKNLIDREVREAPGEL